MLDLFSAHTHGSLQESLGCFNPSEHGTLKTVPSVLCRDGTEISIQASDFHACEPRCLEGPYEQVEVLCTKEIPELSGYLDQERSISGAYLYGYVPVDLIVDAIENRGGLSL